MHKRAFLFLLFFQPVCSALADTPGQPKAFKLNIGGGWGSRFEVRMLDLKLHYTESTRRYGDLNFKVVRSATFTPSVKQWAHFRKMLDQLRAWNWQAEYVPETPESDGTKWDFMIIYPDGKIVSRGDNKYPGSKTKDGEGTDTEPTPPFRSFLNEVQSLVGDLPIR